MLVKASDVEVDTKQSVMYLCDDCEGFFPLEEFAYYYGVCKACLKKRGANNGLRTSEKSE